MQQQLVVYTTIKISFQATTLSAVLNAASAVCRVALGCTEQHWPAVSNVVPLE
jgi:hypothetical protein